MQEGSRAGHFDRFSHGAEGEGKIDFEDSADLEIDATAELGLETFGLYLERISSRVERGDAVLSRGVRLDSTGEAGTGTGDGDGGVGNDGPGRIIDITDQGGGGLRVGRGSAKCDGKGK